MKIDFKKAGIIIVIAAVLIFFVLLRITAVSGEEKFEMVVNTEYLDIMKILITEADKEILVLHFEFHYDNVVSEIQKLLVDANKRGVKVKLLIENSLKCNKSSEYHLKKLGLDIKLDSEENYQHNKVIIVDKKYLLVGSSNLSYMSLLNNNETNLYTESEKIAGFFRKYFFRLWEKDSHITETITGDTWKIIYGKNSYDEILSLLNKAEKRIYLIMYGINFNPDRESMINELIYSIEKASTRGVDVRVLLETSNEGFGKGISDMNMRTYDYLRSKNISVFLDSPEIITHAKLLITDNIVVVGAANWGYNSFYKYNNTTVTVNDQNLAEEFIGYFEKCREDGLK